MEEAAIPEKQLLVVMEEMEDFMEVEVEVEEPA